MKFSGNVRNAMRNKWLDFGSDLWAVCLSLSILLETYEWILMKFSGKIEDGTSNKPWNFGSDPWFVYLLLAILFKTYEWISMKFSGKIEDGTSNEPLNFGNDLWPWRSLRSTSAFLVYNCFILYITLLFLFSRDADSRKGTLCPFCVPIHKKKIKSKKLQALIGGHGNYYTSVGATE